MTKGKRAKSAARRNKKYEPVRHSWKNLESDEILEDFPVKWIPGKLKTVVRKHCAEHASMDYNMLKSLTEDSGDEDSGKEEGEEEGLGSDENMFGVYMLILENEECGQKCQVYFNYCSFGSTKIGQKLLKTTFSSVFHTRKTTIKPHL